MKKSVRLHEGKPFLALTDSYGICREMPIEKDEARQLFNALLPLRDWMWSKDE